MARTKQTVREEEEKANVTVVHRGKCLSRKRVSIATIYSSKKTKTVAGQKKRKKRRNKPGTVALREIKVCATKCLNKIHLLML